MTAKPAARGERGIALVVALLVLLCLTLTSMVFLTTMRVETKLTGLAEREAQALAIAMAGIEEAKARIAGGDVPDNSNANQVSVIFNVAAGSVPTLGTDSTAVPTAQPTGAWLNYSTAARGTDMLTIKYRKNAANQILRYDKALVNKIQTASGKPIFLISSTGRVGNTRKRIEAEFIRETAPVNMKAAAVAGKQIQTQDHVYLCGHDHFTTTPSWKGSTSARNGGAGDCNENLGAGQWETGNAILGGWAAESYQQQAPASAAGSPSGYAQFQAGFYAGPWECLLMTQTNWWTFIGARTSSIPGTLNGLIHVDNDGTHQNQSGSWTINSGSGQGILYLDGGLQINGDFVWRGLIYAEKQIQVQGRLWVLGAIVSREGIQIQSSTAGSAILFSEAMISQAISTSSSEFVRVGWREY